MKRVGTFILFLALWFHGVEQCAFAATNDLFLRGVNAFDTGSFSDAAKTFREAAERKPASGTLVNLGLTEWRRGRAGRAILAWEQALWIDPFDSRAKGNLNYARQLTGVESPELTWFERASAWLPVNTWAWLAGASLWLGIGLSVLPRVFRWRRSGWHQAVAAVSFGVFLLSLPALVGVVTRTRIGFVLQRDAPLRLTPTAEAESLAKLNAGEPLRTRGARGDYVFVQTSRGQGWIAISQLGRICPR